VVPAALAEHPFIDTTDAAQIASRGGRSLDAIAAVQLPRW